LETQSDSLFSFVELLWCFLLLWSNQKTLVF
jgi:hypothetical protein